MLQFPCYMAKFLSAFFAGLLLPFVGRKRRTGREKYNATPRIAISATAACILLFSSAKNVYIHA